MEAIRQKNTHGFTLIELMMAAALTTVIIGGALTSLSVVLHAYKQQSQESNHADIAHLIFQRMHTDLVSTFISPHGDTTRFVSTNPEDEEMARDTLTFISTINNPNETGIGTSDVAEVQYYIDTDDSTPERWLLRRYDATPDNDPFTGGDVALFGIHAVSLNFQFWDGTMWWSQWNSSQEIPLMVYVTIGFFEPTFQGEIPDLETIETFSTMIPIQCYRQPPEDSLGPMGGVAQEQGSGTSNTQ